MVSMAPFDPNPDLAPQRDLGVGADSVPISWCCLSIVARDCCHRVNHVAYDVAT